MVPPCSVPKLCGKIHANLSANHHSLSKYWKLLLMEDEI